MYLLRENICDKYNQNIQAKSKIKLKKIVTFIKRLHELGMIKI
jgi:hypothetical protein